MGNPGRIGRRNARVLQHPSQVSLEQKPMQTNDSCPYQSHGHDHCCHEEKNPAEPPAVPDLDYALVLADAIEQERFRDGEAVLLCPGCGEVTKHLYSGLSGSSLRIDAQCLECDTKLHRWSAVVTPNVSTAPPSAEDLRRLVVAHWEHQFRIGVQDNRLPFTREFTDEVQRLTELWIGTGS